MITQKFLFKFITSRSNSAKNSLIHLKSVRFIENMWIFAIFYDPNEKLEKKIYLNKRGKRGLCNEIN